MRRFVLEAVIVALLAPALLAQLTLPPSGDNQKSSVTQHIGPIRVTIDYNSPDVHAPNGEDRRGKIWGTLVPYGLTDLGFGTCKACPWRAGANENTTFEVSHDVLVQGQRLPAGRYGLHMIADPAEWTIIFSRDADSWGSYYYDEAKDVLRVKAKPAKNDYREWLTYEFIDRKPDRATVALMWEELQVPFTVAAEDIAEAYLSEIRRELRGPKGFQWQNWNAAAQYALRTKKNLPEGLQWAQNAVRGAFYSQENFTTLSTLAALQEANGMAAEAATTRLAAMNHRTAGPADIHGYARMILAQGKKDEALQVWQLNAKKFGTEWPVNVGLARGYSAVGNYKEALRYARLALRQAPDPANRQMLEGAIKRLEEGKDMN